MQLAGKLDIPLLEKDITAEELYAADECFLTGTAAEVIAVTRVDGNCIGDGKVGTITRRLMDAFRDFVRSQEGQ